MIYLLNESNVLFLVLLIVNSLLHFVMLVSISLFEFFDRDVIKMIHDLLAFLLLLLKLSILVEIGFADTWMHVWLIMICKRWWIRMRLVELHVNCCLGMLQRLRLVSHLEIHVVWVKVLFVNKFAYLRAHVRVHWDWLHHLLMSKQLWLFHLAHSLLLVRLHLRWLDIISSLVWWRLISWVVICLKEVPVNYRLVIVIITMASIAVLHLGYF